MFSNLFYVGMATSALSMVLASLLLLQTTSSRLKTPPVSDSSSDSK